jgi:hypothetical protein
MAKSTISTLAVFLVPLIIIPSILHADYLYPDSAALQPLAVIEPAAPDGLFRTWTGEIDRSGRSNLGLSMDFLRSADDSDDWDAIFSATGSFRSGNKLLFGITVPYIIRDPAFNESDLLDLRAFARMKLTGRSPGFGISGELSAILPTAGVDTQYPFTLDTPVTGLRFAFYGGTDEMRAGASIGYQSYLQTETGDDADLIYGAWLEGNLNGPWNLVAEYSGSRHLHTGPPGDGEVSDDYVLLGLRRIQSRGVDFGIAAGAGIGADSVADIRVTAAAIFRMGAVEEKGKKVTPAKRAVAPAPGDIIVVMIAEGIAGGDAEKRITRALQQNKYATGMDPRPGVRITDRTVLYHMPGMREQAIRVSRTLISGGHLMDLQIEEAKTPLARNWLLLVLGGER